VTCSQDPFFNGSVEVKPDFQSPNLNTGAQDVAELTTGHIIFATLYVNADTWSLMY